MSFEMFAEVNHLVLQFALAIICMIGASYAWIILQFLRHRRNALAAEKRLLSEPLPPDCELPHVLVQVPTFNEGDLICRIAAAIGELDWPANLLHVQFLDDSTDGSVTFAERAVAMLRQRNIDATLLHRQNRYGFKGGALSAGLQLSDHEFVAMLDADYVPPKEFLKSCIRPLLRDPRVAFAQGRPDFLNANETLVTWVQQRILDALFAIEQAGRNWSGQIMPFNGTCGIWRRAAIEQAGGWKGDTLTEDADLSLRAQLLGWRASFLMSVAVPGELPTTFKAWVSQQFRWIKGWAEVNRKMLPAVLSSQLSLQQKIAAIVHLWSGVYGPMLGLALICGTIDLTVGMGITFGTAVLDAIIALQLLVVPSMVLLGQREIRHAKLLPELLRLPIVICVHCCLHLLIWRATVEAWLGFKTGFVRTAKEGGRIGSRGAQHSDPAASARLSATSRRSWFRQSPS